MNKFIKHTIINLIVVSLFLGGVSSSIAEHDGTEHEAPPNNVPVAIIQLISPNPAVWSQDVTFTGRGTDADGDAIIAYNWRSSLQGQLATTASYTAHWDGVGVNLAVGTHTIYFKVQDSKGEWSNEITSQLQVTQGQPTIMPDIVYAPTFTTLWASKKSIKLGQTVILKGKMGFKKGGSVGGGVTLFANGKKIKQFNSKDNGSFAIKLKPKKTTVYKAKYNGDMGAEPSMSKPVKVTVKGKLKKKKK